MSELKPCPFCGSEDVLIERYGDSRKSTIVSCQNCACVLESNENFNHGADWNHRPIEDDLRAQLAESQKRIEECLTLLDWVEESSVFGDQMAPKTRTKVLHEIQQKCITFLQKGKDND